MRFARNGWTFFLGLALAIGGHAFAAAPDLKAEAGTGLVFGAFDITESDLAVTHAVLLRLKPTKVYMGSSGERETVTYSNGEFFSPNLAPGLYCLNGFFSGNAFFALEKSLRNNTFQVEAGRVTYAGTYKLSLKKGGLFKRDKGTFARIDAPGTETHLLRWLTKELSTTGWAPHVNARLAEAGGK